MCSSDLGFVGSNGVLVAMPGQRVLLTDSRYSVAARDMVEDTEVVIAGRDLMDRLAEVVPQGRVGIEAEHVSVARRDRFAARMAGAELVPTSGLVEGLRVVKGEEELDLIREATRIADAALSRLVADGFRGRTEAAVAWEIGRAHV